MAGDLRSPRKRALEIGTDPSGFQETPYDAQAGTPPEEAGGTYRELEPQVEGGPGPVNTPTPFSNLKG